MSVVKQIKNGATVLVDYMLRTFLTPYFRPICDRRGLGGMAGLASSFVAK